MIFIYVCPFVAKMKQIVRPLVPEREKKLNRLELAKIKEKALENHIPIIMDDTLEVIEKELEQNKPNKILEIGRACQY